MHDFITFLSSIWYRVSGTVMCPVTSHCSVSYVTTCQICLNYNTVSFVHVSCMSHLLKNRNNLTSKFVHCKYQKTSWKYNTYFRPLSWYILLSRSSLEPLISLDLVSTKLYCFRDRVHCYYWLYIIFLANPVRYSEELRGGPMYL